METPALTREEVQAQARAALDAGERSISQAEGEAEETKNPRTRQENFTDTGFALITAKKETELRKWVDSLIGPSDRAAACIGAAMAAARLDTEESRVPEAMMGLN